MAHTNYSFDAKYGKDENCPDCLYFGRKCPICHFKHQNVIVMNYERKDVLSKLEAKMAADQIIANNATGKEMIKRVRELAEEYSPLEVRTQHTVRTIQSYGRDCKKGAEDFLEDGNVGEPLDNIEEAKTFLGEAPHKYSSFR
jgi:hypothetical protein